MKQQYTTMSVATARRWLLGGTMVYTWAQLRLRQWTKVQVFGIKQAKGFVLVKTRSGHWYRSTQRFYRLSGW